MKSGICVRILILCCTVFPLSTAAQSGMYDAFKDIADIVVAADGSGDYTTVTAAVNAVPDNSSLRTVMFIRNGTYKEKILVPSSKKNLVMVGEDVDSVILTYDDYANLVGGTFNTPSFRVDANNFWAMNLTFQNTAGDVGQALALYTNGDKQVFLHCRMEGWQDTFYSGSPYRNYIKDCFIAGAVDFIFGETVIIYDSCQIHSVRTGGYLTAASTNQNYAFGYVFRNCNITGAPGISSNVLGRPWKAYAQTVFMDSYLQGVIKAAGWQAWNGNEQTCYYAEYNNSGPGYVPDKRVSWSHILTDEEALTYTMENIFSGATGTSYSDDWLPDVDNDSLYRIVKERTQFFMDSTNSNANIKELKYLGDGTLDFDPNVYLYGIELPGGTVEVPEFTVTAEDPRAIIDIEYPESLPGVTTIRLTAYDRSTTAEYQIYNSIDGAYDNAYLDSLYIKKMKVEDFQPDKFEYDFVLPEGSSVYFAVDMYKQVKDARASYQRPSGFPGILNITVTSFSQVVVNEYKVNLTLATAIDEEGLSFENDPFFLGEDLVFRINQKAEGRVAIEIFDLKGNLVECNSENLPGGTDEYAWPVTLPAGIYLYRISSGFGIKGGKLIKYR